MEKPIWAVGLMTGTVLDGNIDVALLKTDGRGIAAFGAHMLVPYAPEVRVLLTKALAAAGEWNFQGPDPAVFARAEEALTRAQAGAVATLLDSAGLSLTDIGVVGFHGQTVLHRAPQPGRIGQTRQLGDGELMAGMLGVPVACDFRVKDMEAGGQGAPLCSSYHGVLLDELRAGPEMAVLNLGGVANISWRDGEGELVGFDTGPASAPLNDFVVALGLGEMDRDGRLALAGRVDETALAKLLAHPYFAAPYPKSLDRNDFTLRMAEGLGAEDGAALLTAFIAASVGRGLDLLPERPEKLIVTGGGRHNQAIMGALNERAGVEAVLAESVGWSGEAIEAQCFAFLGVRVLRGLPFSFPATTGVPTPMCGGRLAGQVRD
ncbi:MAG TPA: anhydro-N-acetylmuramic acid kinase [Devosia sp.]|nr:anhydro-N-acetylmuramic acid kinase [Devosia sp.]